MFLRNEKKSKKGKSETALNVLDNLQNKKKRGEEIINVQNIRYRPGSLSDI